MAYDPDLEPVLEELRNTMSVLDSKVEGLASSVTALDTKLDTAVADLSRRIDEIDTNPTPGPTPEPTPKTTLFGYTRSGVGTELSKAGVVRDFTGGKNPEAYKISRTLNEGSELWYSWKPDLLSSNWINGVEDTLRSAVKAGDPKLYITVWHEPEGSSDAGGGSPAQKIPRWQAAQTALHDIAKRMRADGLEVYVAPIICDWTFWWTSKGKASDWYSADWDGYDLMGFDVYPQGQMASGVGRIARLTTLGPYDVAPYDHDIRTDTYDAVRLCSELAADRGKPWGSGETGIMDGSRSGVDVEFPYSHEQRAKRFDEITDDIISLPHPPALWCWYNDGGCRITGSDNESVASWNRSLAL